jgi:hypothetical protein
MSRLTYVIFTKEMKSKVAEIIIKFNFLELSIKEIIALYIHSDKTDFINQILLNNSIISFNSKLSLLNFIADNEDIKFSIKQELHSLIKIRNAIAHSDNLFNMDGDIIGHETVDDEFNIEIPIYAPSTNGPKIAIFNSGKFSETAFDTYYKEFNEKIITAEKWLTETKSSLREKIK